MAKSIYTQEYTTFTRLLRDSREAAALTQVELAQKLGQSQSFVSKYERGERRLDVIQLRKVCLTLGVSLPVFIERLERALRSRK